MGSAMPFELFPTPGDPGERELEPGRSGEAVASEERRLVRDGTQVLARGALVCPACALPISPAPRLRPRAALRCPFCAHEGAALAFVAEAGRDASANRVSLIARLA